MKIGTRIHLVVEDETTGKKLRYRSKLIDKYDSYYVIDLPIQENSYKTTFIANGTNVQVQFLAANDDLYQFPSKVIRRVSVNVPALAITKPLEDTIQKIQRRKFFRVEANIPVNIFCHEDTFPSFQAITKDISGGGIAITLPELDILKEIEHVMIQFTLPFEMGEKYSIKTEGKMVRVDQEKKIVAFAFINLAHADEEKIVQYCFEKQRKNRMMM